jgi:two-component system, OmpR family, response regulator BaeR
MMNQKPPRILIVEDEPKLATLLADYLRPEGYLVEMIGDGLLVIEGVKRSAPDLILLDLMLPGRDGLSLCRELRGFSNVPIMMMTARVEEVDRLLGLDSGADDYICKPYSPREVVARVRAVLRRSRTEPYADGLMIDMTAGRALLNGCDLGLTIVELRLLNALAAHPGRIFSRDRLQDAMYPDAREVVDRTVDSHIKKLRHKINAVSPASELIHSVYGMGYRYEPQPRPRQPDQD